MRSEFKPSGTRLRPTLSMSARKLVLALSVTLLASLLVGCQTTGTRISVTNEALCVDPVIRYSRRDTAPTIVQVREHNAYHDRLGCPK